MMVWIVVDMNGSVYGVYDNYAKADKKYNEVMAMGFVNTSIVSMEVEK